MLSFAARLGAEEPVKRLILPGESFLVEGRPAFILLPPEERRQKPQPWVMYAPTLPAYPDSHEKWMHEQFLAAGVAVAGIDAGEAYGSPNGQKLMSALYDELTQNRGFAAKPCLLGRSRGGLWVSSWAIANPDKVAGIAGIYPVFDLTTYPGLAKAAPAYGMTAQELESSLTDHNPIARIDVLAKAKVPVCIIHGDTDKVVPLAKNSAILAERYKQAGAADSVTLIVAEGQGHNFWEGFFRCQELVDFTVQRAKAGAASDEVGSARPTTVRVASVQAKRRLVDWRIKQPAEVLKAVDENLAALEEIVHKAGEQKCDVLAFPEDTLGLLNWYGMNEKIASEVLPEAVSRMLSQLGRAAAMHHMYLVVCSDFIESDGATYNTAFFLGRDGKEIGRYYKTCPTWSESASRARGKSLPVFATDDLGTVGMLICYDLVFPETARGLALAGADVIFFPTMGGAAVGDDDIGLQALRVRAAENHVYLVVAFRGSGSMIISPRGKILARAEGPDGLAVADIDPQGGRQGGDAMNYQHDMRARLFRERNPAAFGILTEPSPPILDKVPIDITKEEAGRIAAEVLTIGEEEFQKAEALARKGDAGAAVDAYVRLQTKYRGSWIERVAAERLRTLRSALDKKSPPPGTEP
jgi:predicted amidohydrolase/predicted esterase